MVDWGFSGWGWGLSDDWRLRIGGLLGIEDWWLIERLKIADD
jgi:hypothetical protein